MALYKEKETRFGITAGYWRLGTITVDRNMKEASFAFNLYLDRDSEDFFESIFVTDLMGKEDKTDYNFYFEDMSEYTNIASACYEYAKVHVEYFADAEDV